MLSTSPRLWIIATPLGNPGDLSPRAREIIEAADLVLAEDTRLAQSLFRQCGITRPHVTSFYEHNEEKRLAEVLNVLRSGGQAAIISDAGTPLLADPGFRLVEKCRAENIPVSPVPGPSAPIAALSAAGLAPIPFSFLGFLPRGIGERKKLFKKFSLVPGSLVFFERKDRLCESLQLAYMELGDRRIAICREMTKAHEEFILGELKDFNSLAANLLGEITVILGPPANAIKSTQEEAENILGELLELGEKPKMAIKRAAQSLLGWTGKELYDLARQIKNKSKENKF